MRIFYSQSKFRFAASLVLWSPAFAADPWHHEPYLLKAGDAPLDIATSLNKDQFNKPGKENAPGNFVGDTLGHAAPWYEDYTGRGVKDLVVGGFGGGFRIYRNQGSTPSPRFSKDYEFLRGGNDFAQVHIHCCIASNPRFVDLTGDGVLDMMSGGWFYGELSWWPGLGGGKFGAEQVIQDEKGATVYVETVDAKDQPFHSENFAAVGYPVDWYNDGVPALLIGTVDGKLLVRRRTGGKDKVAYSNQNDVEILIDGQRAMPDHHASPIVVDWDGDGRWDILSGSLSGTVYFFPNSGRPGFPEFKKREVLLAGGTAEQWVERGEWPKRGIRSYPQAVDFNGDGKLDLLLGDFCVSITPREGLTPEDKKEMTALRQKIDDLDRRAGFDQRDIRGRSRAYARADDQRFNEEFNTLFEQLAPYLQLYHLNKFASLNPICSHGLVWVYLRK